MIGMRRHRQISDARAHGGRGRTVDSLFTFDDIQRIGKVAFEFDRGAIDHLILKLSDELIHRPPNNRNLAGGDEINQL